MMFVSFQVEGFNNKDYIDNIVIQNMDIYSTNDLRNVEEYIKSNSVIYKNYKIRIINWKRL